MKLTTLQHLARLRAWPQDGAVRRAAELAADDADDAYCAAARCDPAAAREYARRADALRAALAGEGKP